MRKATWHRTEDEERAFHATLADPDNILIFDSISTFFSSKMYLHTPVATEVAPLNILFEIKNSDEKKNENFCFLNLSRTKN